MDNVIFLVPSATSVGHHGFFRCNVDYAFAISNVKDETKCIFFLILVSVTLIFGYFIFLHYKKELQPSLVGSCQNWPSINGIYILT